MRKAAFFAFALLALSGCWGEGSDAPELDPLPAQTLSSECLRKGGEMAKVGALSACIRNTKDAGKVCTTSGDCEGACLARSGTCAPVTPLYGCHDILLSNGVRASECRG